MSLSHSGLSEQILAKIHTGFTETRLILPWATGEMQSPNLSGRVQENLPESVFRAPNPATFPAVFRLTKYEEPRVSGRRFGPRRIADCGRRMRPDSRPTNSAARCCCRPGSD